MKRLFAVLGLVSLAYANPTVTRIGDGPAENRVQLVIIGDGYTAEDITDLYIPTVNSTLEYMFEHPIKTRPYPRYKKFMNVYRIDIESEDSGVDLIYGRADNEKVYRNTALGGEDGCTDYAIQQICGADWNLVHETIDAIAAAEGFLPQWYLVLLNDTRYNAAAHWAGGRRLPIYSAHYEGNWDVRDIAMHEAAHAWHDLADEYGGSGAYTGNEPSEANVTIDPTGAKWSHWLGYILPEGDAMGVFEGGKYKNSGVYRPSDGSKMNGGPGDCHSLSNDCGHNMVAIEKIIHDFYDLVDPIDSLTDTTATLIDPAYLSLTLIDSTISMVDWIIDGDTILPYGPTQLNLAEHLSTPGNYIVTARVWDEVIAHAFSDNTYPHPLDLVRTGLDKLEKSVSWSIEITADFNTVSSSEYTVASSYEYVLSSTNTLIDLSSTNESSNEYASISSYDNLTQYESSTTLSSEERTPLFDSKPQFVVQSTKEGFEVQSQAGTLIKSLTVWDLSGHMVYRQQNNNRHITFPESAPTGALLYTIDTGKNLIKGMLYRIP